MKSAVCRCKWYILNKGARGRSQYIMAIMTLDITMWIRDEINDVNIL